MQKTLGFTRVLIRLVSFLNKPYIWCRDSAWKKEIVWRKRRGERERKEGEKSFILNKFTCKDTTSHSGNLILMECKSLRVNFLNITGCSKDLGTISNLSDYNWINLSGHCWYNLVADLDIWKKQNTSNNMDTNIQTSSLEFLLKNTEKKHLTILLLNKIVVQFYLTNL